MGCHIEMEEILTALGLNASKQRPPERPGTLDRGRKNEDDTENEVHSKIVQLGRLVATHCQRHNLYGAVRRSASVTSAMEQDLFNLTNAARTQQGLAPLQWNDQLAQAAKSHAALIIQNSQLSHQYSGEADLTARAGQAGAHFQTVAENMAQGSSADSIQKQWMNSPPHRANILDAKLDAVGFSVVKRGDTLYAVADFARIVPNLSNDQVEAAIAKLLASRGIQADGSNPDARKTCEMDHGSAGDTKPGFIMRWQSGDLNQLPSELEERLQTKKYQRADRSAPISELERGGLQWLYRRGVALLIACSVRSYEVRLNT